MNYSVRTDVYTTVITQEYSFTIMDKKPKLSSKNVWLGIGAAILIILLIVWLTVANLSGDTDVAAMIPVITF